MTIVILLTLSLVVPWIIEYRELDRKCTWVAEAKRVTSEVMSCIICIFIKFLQQRRSKLEGVFFAVYCSFCEFPLAGCNCAVCLPKE